MTAAGPLLVVEDLRKAFSVRRPGGGRGFARALDGVSFTLDRGETLGIVGESGSGKSTLALALLRLVEPDSGRVTLDGEDFLALSGEALRRFRRRLQIVFQDPSASLNPRHSVGALLVAPLAAHGLVARAERRRLAALLAERVGLPPDALARRPAEFSGGQRQRIAIARALAVRPDLLVLDEPVSDLDPPARTQTLALLSDLQREYGLAFLFITHDLAAARGFCRRVAVMLGGRIVEDGPAEGVLGMPRHPYTEALLRARPATDPAGRGRMLLLPGEPADPVALPPGCVFAARCPRAEAACRDRVPGLTSLPGGRRVACHVAVRETV